MPERPIPVRLSDDIIDRADAIVPTAHVLPEFSTAKPNRSSVLRLAIVRGLEVIEKAVRRKGRAVRVTANSSK